MITLAERQQNRVALKRLNDLLEQIETSIERGEPMRQDLAQALRHLTETDDIGGHLAAITELRDSTETEYRRKLRLAAPTSLSCFAEFMFPDEPPQNTTN